MLNLSVYKVKPQVGKGKFKTLHRDNLLPIGKFVRMPVLDATEDVPTRPETCANGRDRHKRVTPNHSTPRECETSAESSDLE